MSMKNSNDTVGNRTRDLPACSALGIAVLYKKLPSKRELREDPLNDSHNLRKGVNEFHGYVPYLLTDLGEIRYEREVMLLGN
jgi:hypothetical protein